MTTPPTSQHLDEIEARAASECLTPGPWTLDREQCDCSDGYCHHGAYITGVVTPVPTEIAAERCQRTGEQPRDYDFHRSEIGDFTEADWELMVHAREDVPALLAEVCRLPDRVAELEEQMDRWRRTAYRVACTHEPDADAPRTLTEGEYSAAWHAVEGAAGEEGADPATVLHAVRARLGIARPGTAPPAEEQQPTAEACGKCHRPFDPADTSFDGAARYHLTPYCLGCVDACPANETPDHQIGSA